MPHGASEGRNASCWLREDGGGLLRWRKGWDGGTTSTWSKKGTGKGLESLQEGMGDGGGEGRVVGRHQQRSGEPGMMAATAGGGRWAADTGAALRTAVTPHAAGLGHGDTGLWWPLEAGNGEGWCSVGLGGGGGCVGQLARRGDVSGGGCGDTVVVVVVGTWRCW